MKKLQLGGLIARGLAAGAAIMSFGTVIEAAPYATSLTNSSGTISFRLNEAADDVKIISSSGTVDLGACAAGLITTNLTISGTYSVQASKAGSGVVSQISVDGALTRFNNSRGMTVNHNPASPFFGRIYVANAAAGTTVAGSRAVGDGIYLLNSDFSDALGQGNTARTAGLNSFFTSGGGASPMRVTIGEGDDRVYITDWSDASGNLYVADGNLATNSVATNVLSAMPAGKAAVPVGVNVNHGSIIAAAVTGSMANGDLTVWTVDEDLQLDRTSTGASQLNSLWRYDVGASTNALPYNDFQGNLVATASITTVSQSGMDVARGTNGYFYYVNGRSAGNEANLKVLDSGNNSANLLFDSKSASINTLGLTYDYLSNAVSVAVSPDMKYLALARLNNNVVVCPLVDGIPDLTTVTTFNAFPTSAANTSTGTRQISFDAADNIYVVNNFASSSGQLMRCFSLGLTTTTTTTSDGTFSLTSPSTSVAVTADTDTIYEAGPTAATLTFTRTSTDLSQPLTVVFKMSDTASNSDYVLATNSVTLTTNAVVIPAGLSSVDVTMTAVDDSVSELTETATVTVLGSTVYSPGVPSTKTIAIVDNDPQVLAVTAVVAPSMYKGHTNDFASFRITRYGDTNVPSYSVANFTYGGAAVLDTDYTGVQPVSIDPGAVTAIGKVSPLQLNNSFFGNKSITVTLASGTDYTVGASNITANLTLVDNANPVAPVIYSNPLTDPNDATNWNVTYANADMANHPLDDYEVSFGYDLTANNPASAVNGVIPLPPNGATTALRVTVNTKYPDPFGTGATAGVNVYPTNVTFSGDYAVRFNMNLIQPAGGGLTEGVVFGINHNGQLTNWWTGDGLITAGSWSSDGIWYWIDSTPGGAANGDYIEFTGKGGQYPNTPAPGGWQFIKSGVFGSTSFANSFKSSAPYTTSGSGIPANGSPLNFKDASAWSDVEIKQVKNVVTLSIDKTAVFTYTNTTTFTNGTLMLGFGDPFSSAGMPDGAAYFSNLRVVRLAGPSISSMSRTGTSVVVNFASTDGDDAASSFALQSSTDVAGPYSDVSGATVTQLGSGAFQVTGTSSSQTQFFRIRHK
jgi:hypothetical protein